jgi:hypothetical protein
MKANINTVTLVIFSLLGLTACNFSDDDTPKPNQSPMALDASIVTQTDTPVMDNLSATDADNDALTFNVIIDPMSGTLTLMGNGSFTYTPAKNFVGSDSFVFSASDGISTAAEAAVNITIETLQLSFGEYSRQAFNQTSSDSPLPINGRAFTQDVIQANAYDDLINK